MRTNLKGIPFILLLTTAAYGLLNNFSGDQLNGPGESPKPQAVSSSGSEDEDGNRGLETSSASVPKGLLPPDYNNFLRPKTFFFGDLTKVMVKLVLHGVRGLNENEEVLTVQMDVLITWNDHRIKARNLDSDSAFFVNVNPRLIHKLWQPHLYIKQLLLNSKTSLITTPTYLKISKIGVPMIVYNLRSTVGLACKMHMKYYPRDLTTCDIDITSYLYGDADLQLEWLDMETMNGDYLRLPGFTVETPVTNYSGDMAFMPGKKDLTSSLHYEITLQRHIWDQILRTYLPSGTFVIISWCSFLIPKENALERTGVALSSLLSLMVLHNSVGQNLQHVTELTALHIWVLTCCLFVFLPLVETLIVIKLWGLEKEAIDVEIKLRAWAQRKIVPWEVFPQNLSKGKTGSGVDFKSLQGAELKARKLAKIAKVIERVTRFSLPVIFFMFNMIYWPWLIMGSQERPTSNLKAYQFPNHAT